MKILIITQRWWPDSFGGSEYVVAGQARELVRAGHDVVVLTERIRDDFKIKEEEQIGSGVLVIQRYGREGLFKRFGSSLVDRFVLPKLIRGVCKENNFDKVLIHHPYPALAWLRSRVALPFYYFFHASTAKEAEVEGLRRGGMVGIFKNIFVKYTYKIEKEILSKAKGVAVLSDFSAQLLGEFAVEKIKITKLTIGIANNKSASESKLANRKNFGLDSEDKIILSVRRLTPRMGLENLINTLILLPDNNIKLLIAGVGSLYRSLTKQIAEANLQDRVTLLGRVETEELNKYYQVADLFVLPTIAFEGLGISTLEALSIGLPVVGTPVGATPEILSGIDSRLLSNGIESEDLAKAIKNILALSKEELSALSTKAKSFVKENYNWQKAIAGLEKFLK